jgi:hypothetical protein
MPICFDGVDRLDANEEHAAHKRNAKKNAGMRPSRRGAKGRNRTADTGVFSTVLYRLSYLGEGTGSGAIPCQPQ